MKDLDFDELDRAVNSLMTNVPKSDMPKPEETEKTLEITPTLDSKPVQPPHTPDEMPAKPAGPTAPPSAAPAPHAPAPTSSHSVAVPSRSSSVASRRGGRFMDVVHPSSDMKAPTPAAPARSIISRQGVTITPSAFVHEPVTSPAPARTSASTPVPKPVAAEKEDDTKSPVTPSLSPTLKPHVSEQASSKSDWPDPLELADFKDDSKKPETPTEPKPEEEVAKDESSPLTSPFLSGTKVEKRPLGGNNSSASEPGDEPDRAPAFGAKADTDMTVSDPEAQLPPKPKEVEPELPEELKGDLMAIEADTTTHQQKDVNANAVKSEEPAKPKSDDPGKETDSKSVVKSEDVGMPTPTTPLRDGEKPLAGGPTSIPQQYREEPSSGDKDNGAIYDTDTYHQPLTHPAKSKPSWLWVVWIIAILIIGAAAGATLYLLGVV